MDLFGQATPPFFSCTHPEMCTITENTGIFQIEMPGASLIWAPHFFAVAQASGWMDYLLAAEDFDWRKAQLSELTPSEIAWKHVQWQHAQIKMFGKTVFEPRFTAWHGDKSARYSYAGREMNPAPWNPVLEAIRDAASEVAQATFNSVLLNWYRDGTDSMGWHRDNEKELGRNPVIASVNLGATRKFVLRKSDQHTAKASFELVSGSLLVMAGSTQHFWHHSIPKQKKVQQPRINLTFRHIHSS